MQHVPRDTLTKLVADFSKPLTERIRPASFAQYIGQEHLLNTVDGEISNYLRLGYLPSMLLSGPPGVGKTSLARLLANEANYVFVELSATSSTVAELRDLSGSIETENTKRARLNTPRLRVLVFIDEIHRFSTVQQDFLLPFIEAGSFVFVGATTVDPQKRIRRAILSRCHLFTLVKLSDVHIQQVVHRAILYENVRRKMASKVCFLSFSDGAVSAVVEYANGDMRSAVNVIELVSTRLSGADYHVSENAREYSVDEGMVAEFTRSLSKARFGLQSESNLPLLAHLLKCLRNPKSQPFDGFSVSNLDNKTQKTDSTTTTSEQTDSDLESWADETELVEYTGDNPQLKKWADHIPHSDDDEADSGPLYSEDDIFPEKADLSRHSASKFRILSATHTCLQLLKKGESPLSILKYLILFTCTHSMPEKNELIKVLSVLKAVEKSGIGAELLLYNCLERLAGTEDYEDTSLRKTVEEAKNYFSKQREKSETEPEETKVEYEVVYDEELVDRLLSDLPDDRQPPCQGMEITDLKSLESDFLLGEGLDLAKVDDLESILETLEGNLQK